MNIKRMMLSGSFVLLLSAVAMSQTSAFTYQGKLTDAGAGANGPFDFTFKLYANPTGGTQVGSDVLRDDVPVAAGIFTVSLDFGSSPFTSSTGNYLEIWVRPGAQTGSYTQLLPRSPITSSPYAVQTIRATSAALADNATQLGGLNASQYVQTTDSRMTDARTPTANSPNYIQNTTSQQATSNFNISGTGTANTFNAAGQYNIGGSRVMAASGTNLSVGLNAGFGTGVGIENTFFGNFSGTASSAHPGNSFFGYQSGTNNTGGGNSFFGDSAGRLNTSACCNSFFGTAAGRANTTGYFNTFIGYDAGYSESTQTGNSTGVSNTFIGANTVAPDSSGSYNTLLGANTNITGNNIQYATAIGADATVSQSNSLILGSIANGSIPDTHVGIGTAAPQYKLHINDPSNAGLRVLTNTSGGTVASFGGLGAFVIDTVSTVGGRLTVKENGNVGIGTGNPNAKLQVAGGIVYIAAPNSLVITSPNGTCWFIMVSDAGNLSSFSIACP